MQYGFGVPVFLLLLSSPYFLGRYLVSTINGTNLTMPAKHLPTKYLLT